VELIHRNSDYALRVLIHMGRQPMGTRLSASRLARTEHVSEGFLHKVLHELRRAGMVWSCPGPGGGYALIRPLSEITVWEVLQTLQGPLAINRCLLGRNKCPNQSTCSIRRRLVDLQERMIGLLESTTLADLVGDQSRSAGDGVSSSE